MSESVVTVAKMIASAPALGCYASYVALRTLHEQYAAERAAFDERCRADAEQREQALQDKQTSLADAHTLATWTNQQFSGDVGAAFLRAQLEKLTLRIAALPVSDPTLEARCQALLARIAEPPEALEDLLAEYRQLANLVVTQAPQTPQAMMAEILSLRDEVEEAFRGKQECFELREQMLQRLGTLEQMPRPQALLIKQSLQLLRERLHRELKSITELEALRVREAKELRETVGDVLAKLQALANQQYLPGYAERANTMLSGLSTLLNREESAADLQQFAIQVHKLFHGCEKALEEETQKAYLQDQISDVLLNMGYAVSSISGAVQQREHALLTKVDQHIGVEFHIDNDGRLDTEMVAFSGEGTQANPEARKKVCSLVDEVFAALRERQFQVRERYRATITVTSELRIVEQTATKETTVTSATADNHLQNDL